MTAPKSPEDHKSRAGFARLGAKEFAIRPNLQDDWEFQEILAASENGSPSASIRMANYVFKDDEKAYAALKVAATVDGLVSTKKVGEIIRGIIEEAAPNS